MLTQRSLAALLGGFLMAVASMPASAAEAPEVPTLQVAEANAADRQDAFNADVPATVVTEGSGQPTAAKRLPGIVPRAAGRGTYSAGYPSRSSEPTLILGVRF